MWKISASLTTADEPFSGEFSGCSFKKIFVSPSDLRLSSLSPQRDDNLPAGHSQYHHPQRLAGREEADRAGGGSGAPAEAPRGDQRGAGGEQGGGDLRPQEEGEVKGGFCSDKRASPLRTDIRFGLIS